MTASYDTAVRRLVNAVRKVNQLRKELAEAERMQAVATKQVERAIKAANLRDVMAAL